MRTADLTTLSVDRNEIWEPQLPRVLRASTGIAFFFLCYT
jgi:hypothetical protein